MTDRQIAVLEQVFEAVEMFNFNMNGNNFFPILEEFELIIKEQKELNYAEYKDKRK